MINEIFLPEKVAIINYMPISKFDAIDKYIWWPTKEGNVSIKWTYHLEIDKKCSKVGKTSTRKKANSRWKVIWRLKVPHTIKNFLWRACYHLLPTRSNHYNINHLLPRNILAAKSLKATVKILLQKFFHHHWISETLIWHLPIISLQASSLQKTPISRRFIANIGDVGRCRKLPPPTFVFRCKRVIHNKSQFKPTIFYSRRERIEKEKEDKEQKK